MLKIIKQVSLILLTAILCSVGTVYAADKAEIGNTDIPQQRQKVTGTISDAMGPVTGASVIVKGTTVGTISDINGNYSLEVSNGQTIQISFIGYVPQEIRYTGQS
ncbi:MAG: carboxypeptidase-like regulatory domain-containing protein, partial [Tannerellaceae bacterium]|nr:carboxypeptidase-like regulatory domain-containing protein [Tannerellaceae bacterium]